MVGKRHLVPTSGGHFEWTVRDWGVIAHEKVYEQGYTTENIRLPWGLLERMLETR